MKLGIFVLLMSLVSSFSQADVLKDFDSLGGNDVLLEKAQAISPELKMKIVQKRIVKRTNRHEFSPNIGTVLGGDSYVSSNFVGMDYQYHINPKWSVGLKYNYFMNELSNEGNNLINSRIRDKVQLPELDWPEQSYQLVGNWSPIYGKFNLLDMAIVHFDTYLSLGFGQIELSSGETELYSAGIGLGFWFSQHLTSRIEFRYQNYENTLRSGVNQTINGTAAQFSMGYML